MYVVCLLFYAIGDCFLYISLFLYLSFSFPEVLGSTVSERDDFLFRHQLVQLLLQLCLVR